METFKPNSPSRGRAALLASACLILPVTGGDTRGASSLATSETTRRSVAVDEAGELLKKGDQAYTAGRYADAAVAYAGARELIPDAPLTAALRAAATERFAQASVEQARLLSRKGDVAGAKAVVDKVLEKSISPENPGALAFRAQLDDPIRTNPALTAAHAKDVDAVRRLLYTAEGAYQLGKYDQAETEYQNVLRIDPTNTAARRGLEQVAVARSGYGKSAYDHSRAELLGQVDSLWELQASAAIDLTRLNPGSTSLVEDAVSVKNKLDRIIIPKIALDQASLQEALDFLRLRARENDTLELDPERKGINFAINLGPPDSPVATQISNARFDLQLTGLPLSQILRYITEITRTSFTTDDFAVIITPAGSSSAELVTRTYRVPPDFISTISSGGTATAAPAENPFGGEPAGGGLLATRLGAREALIKQGVAFPEGASAAYIPSTNTLRVVNTATNQDYISQIVETLTKTEPVMVSIAVTMIKVQKTQLEELGFDWLLDNFGFGGASPVPGSSKLNLSGGTVGNGDEITDIAVPPGVTSTRPLTSGNRSGDSAISSNSIDGLFNNRSRQQSNRAPGVLGVRGEINDATVQTLMRGLDQTKNVDLMARPATVTRSGQSSSIAIVREFIYPTEYEPPELPNSVGEVQTIIIDELGGVTNGGGGGGLTPVTPATPTAFETEDVGITLEVLPVVDINKQYVNVTLNPNFSDFDGFVNYGSPINTTVQTALGPSTQEVTPNAILMPVFSKQKFSTSIDVADGSTVVVGGLLQNSVQNVEDQIPIFGSIPILGRLFQSKARKPVSTAILFLVHVELMDPTGRPYRDR